jgi:hypothetical protein
MENILCLFLVSLFFCFCILSGAVSWAKLRTELIRTGSAGQCSIGLFPKAFGMQNEEKLPKTQNYKRHQNQRKRIYTRDKNHWRKHHKMIPIKNTTGRTASVFHDQAKGTPDQNTDQITNIEKNADHEKSHGVQNVRIIQYAEHTEKQDPQNQNLDRASCRIRRMLTDRIALDIFARHTESYEEKLLLAKRHEFFHGNELTDHIDHPDTPQNM